MSDAERITIEVIEAAYRLDLNEGRWLEGIVRSASPLLDAGFGAAVWIYELPGGGVRTTAAAFAGALAALPLDLTTEVNDETPLEADFGGVVGTLSDSLRGGSAESQTETMVRYMKQVGCRDLLRAWVTDPEGFGIGLAAPLSAPRGATRSERRTLGRVVAHLHTALRARRRRTYPFEPLDDAALRPEPAEPRAAREALREAAIRMDQAHSAPGTAHGERPLEDWRAVVDGKWTLVEQFEHGGRRYLVARQYAHRSALRSGLTATETLCAVYVANGHSQKLIAFELGLSEPTVSAHVHNAMRKLGLRSRAELSCVFGASRHLRTPGKGPKS